MKAAVLERLRAARTANRPCVLATLFPSGEQTLYVQDEDVLPPEVASALSADRSGVVEDPVGRRFLHVFSPPLRLIVVGAVHIAQPLVAMASLAGFAVTVVDPRRAFAEGEHRFAEVAVSTDWPDEAVRALAPDARTAVVTLTHDPKLDDPALAVALRSPAFFIGALGSRRTHANRLARLRELGFGEAELARIRGPVGLDIGALSPAEIAVSILAQVIAVRRGEAP
jgi:xanthine dehydrogenase accessory factor